MACVPGGGSPTVRRVGRGSGAPVEEGTVRIRTWLAMAFGAVVGAGSVHLLDPDHGRARRRELAGRVRRGATARVRGAVVAAARQGRTMADEARRGFAEERTGS